MSAVWALRLTATLMVSRPTEIQPTVRVAAVSYPGGAPHRYGCQDDTCAFDAIIRAAAREGVEVVVTSEYSTPQRQSEPRVSLGGRPSAKAPLQAMFSALAAELDLYLAINLETEDSEGKAFNSLVVFDPRGLVVARHDKVELFEGERQALEPGQSVSILDTPYGRLGFLICADLYTEPRLHRTLTETLGAQIVLVSAAWTVPVATSWQAAFAHDWHVFVVAANASLGKGRGGGVFDDRGQPIARPGRVPDLHIADIPRAPLEGSAGSNRLR